MALRIPRALVELILLGPEDDRRQLQDSPILGDVWVEFGKRPDSRLDLLITPYKEQPASATARRLRNAMPTPARLEDATDIAYLQGVIASRLTFAELIRFVVPLTYWWSEPRIAAALREHVATPDRLVDSLRAIRGEAERWLSDRPEPAMRDIEAHRRFSALAAMLLWAAQEGDDPGETRSSKQQAALVLDRIKDREDAVVAHLVELFGASLPPTLEGPFIWTISLNRRATPAVARSVPAVKADAARTLFAVSCSELIWAILDSGIDATHYAFRSPEPDEKKRHSCRVKRAFDFTSIRDIVSLDNLIESHRERRVDAILKKPLLRKSELSHRNVHEKLEALASRIESGVSVNWELVEPLIELDPGQSVPTSNHGTHVAGILGASAVGARKAIEAEQARGIDVDACRDGMCPDINLYDFRVLGSSLDKTEFAIIAALQYIRFVNERNSFMTIHGANLSLSIPHDVRNFACGRTPICNECERLVNSGVVVVAAAGNRGYQNFETSEGMYEGYAAFSVTDPGNADGVITVGATHRFWPHTYGVSFFSSRGPTGDGRLKPDIVAPGERIRAPLPGQQWGDLDGTSMAAPHVSGAAAMLMARYTELVEQPRRIKAILCQSATDLGRERTFQGHGMLDVLRAFQSI